ncbi:hypothetical protein EDD99_6726 [Streptomyces sp. 846.5]|nr:hypothetical protein EDD99_6726 [Streptomyces sp. 846.5]
MSTINRSPSPTSGWPAWLSSPAAATVNTTVATTRPPRHTPHTPASSSTVVSGSVNCRRIQSIQKLRSSSSRPRQGEATSGTVKCEVSRSCMLSRPDGRWSACTANCTPTTTTAPTRISKGTPRGTGSRRSRRRSRSASSTVIRQPASNNACEYLVTAVSANPASTHHTQRSDRASSCSTRTQPSATAATPTSIRPSESGRMACPPIGVRKYRTSPASATGTVAPTVRSSATTRAAAATVTVTAAAQSPQAIPRAAR